MKWITSTRKFNPQYQKPGLMIFFLQNAAVKLWHNEEVINISGSNSNRHFLEEKATTSAAVPMNTQKRKKDALVLLDYELSIDTDSQKLRFPRATHRRQMHDTAATTEKSHSSSCSPNPRVSAWVSSTPGSVTRSLEKRSLFIGVFFAKHRARIKMLRDHFIGVLFAKHRVRKKMLIA